MHAAIPFFVITLSKEIFLVANIFIFRVENSLKTFQGVVINALAVLVLDVRNILSKGENL